MTDLQTRFERDMLPYLAVLGLFLLAASAVQLWLGLRPLGRISDDVAKLAVSPGSRLNGTYPREIHHLVGAVNTLLDTQQTIIDRSRSRAADLAHGLKTPLTVLSNHAAKLRDSGDADLAAELGDLVSAMETRINHELARARIAPGPEYRTDDADLTETVNKLAATLARTPQGELIDWQVDIADGLHVAIDPNDLREMLGNILENAVKWTTSQIIVKSSPITDGDGKTVQLTLEDDGPGIDPALIGNMAARGKRFDEKTPGTGLGLAIVSDIADVYGINLTIQNRQTSGLCVTLALPLGEPKASRS